jgi:hypothetical protein
MGCAGSSLSLHESAKLATCRRQRRMQSCRYSITLGVHKEVIGKTWLSVEHQKTGKVVAMHGSDAINELPRWRCNGRKCSLRYMSRAATCSQLPSLIVGLEGLVMHSGCQNEQLIVR